MEKSELKDTIEHDGIVQNADGKSVVVRITSLSACSGCHAEGSCTLAGHEEKIIEVSGDYKLNTGDNVTVIMQKSMGYAAILIGYVLPLFAVLIIIVILNSLSVPELIAGLSSLVILGLYYIIVYLFRNKINKNFTFKIKI